MSNFSRTLLILAHPDDEALGCGGLLSLINKQGHNTRVVIACSSVQQRDTPYSLDQIHSHFYRSLELLGVSSFKFLNFPNLALNTIPQFKIVQALEQEIAEFMPSVIITHDSVDLNIDHQSLSRAAVVASRLYHRRSLSFLRLL